MTSLRRDPATGRWVVYSEPQARPPVPHWRCPFCPGNEALTPPQIRAWSRDGSPAESSGWVVRVVPSADPLLRIEVPLKRHAEGMYDAATRTGAHEIIVETPEHRATLAELPPWQVERVLAAYAERIADLKKDPRIRSTFLFKNQGTLAGAGFPGHAHSQLIGLPVTPKALKEILEGARRYYAQHERCVFCDMIAEETEQGVRVVDQNEGFVALAPYASRHPFETWVLPRTHLSDYEATAAEDLARLATLLLSVLRRLENALPDPAYNVFLYSGPNREAFPRRWKSLEQDFHWHFQILPRTGQEAGFEVGSGFHANPLVPEKAAEILRAAAAD